MEEISLLPDNLRFEALEGMNPADLVHDWRSWGRPEQFAPEGDWNVWAVIAGRGFGKALESCTPIPTPDGFTRIADLQVGDTVFDHSGRKTAVTGVYPQGMRKCYRVRFDDGTSLVADHDHLWTVIPAAKKSITKYAHEVDVRARSTDWWASSRAVTVKSSELYVGDSIPIQPGLELPDIDLPVDPYTLGAWLGDGTSAEPSICGIDDEIFDRVGRAYPLIENKRDPRNPGLRSARFSWTEPIRNKDGRYGLFATGMSAVLRSRGLIRNKHIPEIYFRASKAQRLELLRGIMDTDGTVNKNGIHAGVGFVNQRLTEDVSRLLHTLGIKHRKWTRLKGVAGRPETRKPFHSVEWRPTPEDNPFHLRRKAERVAPLVRPQATRKMFRRVVAVEDVGLRDATCISVSAESSLFLAGESMITTHNTRCGAEWIREKARENPGCRIALAARTAADVRDVMIEGESGIIAVSSESEKPDFQPSRRRVVWPNGSTALMFSSEEPSQLRGPQFDFSWADEAAAWKFTVDDSGLNAWDNLRLATRLGETPQILATTTPKRTPFMHTLLEDHAKKPGQIKITRGSTYDNLSNLAAGYLDFVTGMYEGTRLAQQELMGLMLDAMEGALFSEEMINTPRLKMISAGLPLRVVAVDPSVAQEPTDECGIVVVGATNQRRMHERHAYILEDATIHGSPEEWVKEVVRMAKKWNAPIVAEKNQGHALIDLAIKAEDPSVKVYAVHSKVGKQLRAEPVALAYEQKRVHHIGYLADLESQMTNWLPGETRKSPDRLDALVHGVTALLIQQPKNFHTGPMRAHSSGARRIPTGRGTGVGRTVAGQRGRRAA